MKHMIHTYYYRNMKSVLSTGSMNIKTPLFRTKKSTCQEASVSSFSDTSLAALASGTHNPESIHLFK